MMAFAFSAPISSLNAGIEWKEGLSARGPVELCADLDFADEDVRVDLDGAIEDPLIVDMME